METTEIYKGVIGLLIVVIFLLILYSAGRKKVPKSADGVSIYTFFLKNRASYLVIPKSVLQACSMTTQYEVVTAVKNVRKEKGDWIDEGEYYTVRKKDAKNRYIKDIHQFKS